MFVTVLAASMIVFAVVTRYAAYRQGIGDGIVHRPTANPYYNATGSRKLPRRTRIQAPWTRYADYYRYDARG
jgi:hypothetical protein